MIESRGGSGLRRNNRGGVRHAARIALPEEWLKQASGEEIREKARFLLQKSGCCISMLGLELRSHTHEFLELRQRDAIKVAASILAGVRVEAGVYRGVHERGNYRAGF